MMQRSTIRTVDAQRLQLKLEIIKRDPVISMSLAPSLGECMLCSTEAKVRLQVWSEHTADPELLPMSEVTHPISD